MTQGGTFVINGAERAIISQIVRSPGMYYGDTVDKADQHTYTTTINPYRGAWLEYETDAMDVFYVRIDKNRKIPITCLIRALGVASDEQIKAMYGEDARILSTLEKDTCKTREESLLEIYRRLRPGEPPTLENAESYLESLFFDPRRYDVSKVGRYKMNKKMEIWSSSERPDCRRAHCRPPDRRDPGHARASISAARRPVNSPTAASTAPSSTIDGKPVVVFSNGMVDMANFVHFDPKEYGIREKVTLLRPARDARDHERRRD